MPNVQFICDYCGHKWDNYLWGMQQIEEEKCRGCKGKASVRPSYDVFGYDYEKKQQQTNTVKYDVFGYKK